MCTTFLVEYGNLGCYYLVYLRLGLICKTLDKPKWVSNVAIGMWLCFSPIYLELYMGQITLFVGILTFFYRDELAVRL